MTTPTEIRPEPKPPRRALRLSVRALMVTVLVLAVVLGWFAQKAKVQREAIAAIRKSGGGPAYDFQRVLGNRGNPNAQPNYPRWLVDRVGVDYFADVVAVMLGKQATDAEMAHVGRLPRLATFNANQAVGVTDAGASQLAGLAHLESINLSGTKVTGASLANFRGMTSLKNLSIIALAISDDDLAHLEGLTGLESVYLSSTQVTDAGLAHLEDLVNLKQLWLNNSLITGPGLKSLKDMTQLKGLLLSRSQVRDLSTLTSLPALEQLTLDENPLDDAQIASLAKLPALKILRLGNTGLTDAGLVTLLALSQGLESLSLVGTGITDAAAPTLLKFDKLENLDLGGTKVTDATLDQIAGLGKLRYLGVTKTAVTDAGIARLQLALPRLSVTKVAPAPRAARPGAAQGQPSKPGAQP